MNSPFNFVPISDFVYEPEWQDYVCHDIPMKDAVSGKFDLTITAKNPIFIRNGHSKSDEELINPNYTRFSHINGKFFIPSSTLRGLLRNNLKILSMGRMDSVEDKRYGYRDLSNRKYKENFSVDTIKCGWMTKNGANITIEGRGMPYRISMEDIDLYFGTSLSRVFTNRMPPRSVFKKIKLITRRTNRYPLQIRFCSRQLFPSNPADKRVKAVISDSGELEGEIIVTGQASPRDNYNKTGKWFEFVFPVINNVEEFHLNEEDEIYNDFLFINERSEDWVEWNRKLNNEEKVPIFYLSDGERLIHFGLAYLYKLPYKNSVKSFLPEAHKKTDKVDLADLMFGNIKTNPLKSRIFVSTAFETQPSIELEERRLYLSSPKASYYPIYIEQTGVNGIVTGPYKTMLDEDAILRGRKKFPVRGEIQNQTPITRQENNMTIFKPLGAGSSFKCTIRYHNLKKEELGALIMAIKFPDFHSIGLGKPFGYGKVKIDFNEYDKVNDEYMNLFKNSLEKSIGNYLDRYQTILNEFKLMSKDQILINDLTYMPLRGFREAKNNREYLRRYSELINRPSPVTNLNHQAKVTFKQGRIIRAKIINLGNSTSQDLIDTPTPNKLKEGDTVTVSIIETGVNKGKYKFLRK